MTNGTHEIIDHSPEWRWEVTPGEEQERVGIQCGDFEGTVVVRTGERLKIWKQREREPRLSLDGAISIRFDGARANSCCWIQFFWWEYFETTASGRRRRPVVTQATGSATAFEGVTTPHGLGRSESTTDPNNPNVNVDSSSAGSPCYEAQGLGEMTSSRNMIWDLPKDALNVILNNGDPDSIGSASEVRKYECVMHFDSYLICDQRVCAHVQWEASEELDLSQPNTSTENLMGRPSRIAFREVTTGGALTDAQKQRLGQEYPDQEIVDVD